MANHEEESKMKSQIEITSVDIPFLQLVWLMSKIIIACIPAVVVACLVVGIWAFGVGFITMIFASLFELVP